MLRSARNLLIATLSLTLGIIIVAVVKYWHIEVKQEENMTWCGTTTYEEIVLSDSLEDKMGQSIANGKMLFEDNCKSCHKIYNKSVGPALRGVATKYDRKWIYAFVRNSKEMIQAADTSALKIFNEYQAEMTAFPSFTDKEIDDILNYIEHDDKCYR